jgi:hypothetical protein
VTALEVASKNAFPDTARSSAASQDGSPGRRSPMPVWFVLEDEKLYLLPVRGSDTLWYQNVLKNPLCSN